MSKVLLTTENVKAWREERDALLARLKTIEARLQAASFFIDESDVGEADVDAPSDDGGKPDMPLVDAIVRVLERFGADPMSNADIKRHLPEFGYDDGSISPNYFYTATKRLVDKGRIVKLKDKRYVLPGSEAHKKNEPPEGGSEGGEGDASPEWTGGYEYRKPGSPSLF